MYVSEPILTLDSKKYHFCFNVMYRNAQNHSFKKWSHQRIWFLDYMFAKKRYINFKFGMLDVQAWFHNIFPVS